MDSRPTSPRPETLRGTRAHVTRGDCAGVAACPSGRHRFARRLALTQEEVPLARDAVGFCQPPTRVDGFMSFSVPASVILFYLGAFNTLLARSAGTCTMGDAERLLGIVPTALLFAAALYAMSVSLRRHLVLIAIGPVLALMAWQTVFATQLAHALLWQGAPACQVLEGIPYPRDGKELFYGIAWPIVSIGMWIGLLVAWRGRPSRQRSTS